jgi:FkbM family methyltransferase
MTYNVALGDVDGKLPMYHHVKQSNTSSFLRTTSACEHIYPLSIQQDRVEVKIATMDAFLRASSVQIEPDLLVKLDVQGYEDRVIRGGRQTLEKARACIVEVSFVSLYQGQASFGGVFHLLDSIGFSYSGNVEQTYIQSGALEHIDALFLK